ncbi:DUF7144 family membrane protein [Actinomadura fibrosa]|uniref:DUF7144 domain-containing protein n=1 Tax=Actinomadura fibrosa TaxID=111802 RepID=A0ABW2XRI9_9ACTN|nr:hypothetical protein [Actinomadura fibrosa]
MPQSHAPTRARRGRAAGTGRSGRSAGWTAGLAAFGGIMVLLNGFLQVMTGFVALLDGDFYVVAPHYPYDLDTTAWGWTQVVVGLLLAATGFAALAGILWARIAVIATAAVSAVAAFLFIPYQPVWSVIVIIADVLVIWAMCGYTRAIAERHSERF